jgi:hypothetical protein
MLQLPKMLMLEMMGFKRQMLAFSAEQAGGLPANLPPAKTDDGVAITDKKHCLDPNVWVDGKCKGDPRGKKSTELERKAACGGGENTPSCQRFTANLVRSRKSACALASTTHGASSLQCPPLDCAAFMICFHWGCRVHQACALFCSKRGCVYDFHFVFN